MISLRVRSEFPTRVVVTGSVFAELQRMSLRYNLPCRRVEQRGITHSRGYYLPAEIMLRRAAL